VVSKITFIGTIYKSGAMLFNDKNYQFWQHDNTPIELWTN